MRLKNMVPLALFAIILCSSSLFAGDAIPHSEFMQGVVVVTFETGTELDIPLEGSQRSGNFAVDQFMDEIDAHKIERMFPHCREPKPGGVDLTVIYSVWFPESFDVHQVSRDFSKVAGVEYAEIWPIDKIALDHNDPGRNDQYFLNLIDANEAHDLSTGSPDAVVAIVDTGMDMDHPDLEGNTYINPGEDINGDGEITRDDRNDEDDDRNGYVDDFYGWDFYGNGQDGNNHRMDNWPNDGSGHGTHCSGLASAITNNEVGVSSVGYSCSIMPLRTGHGMSVAYGYHGIEYAADMGAEVISCSWGGYQPTNWGERVVDYATEEGSLVVCASGNDNSDALHYPCAYENAVAVSATDQNDRKAGFSNYGDWVDVSAPGVRMLSTVPGGGYQYLQGTSMACPVAAGVAVLIRAASPQLTVEETREALLNGADDISRNLGNYADLMGSGRVNAFQSLLLNAVPDLAIAPDIRILEDDDENEKMDPGETVDLSVVIENGEFGTTARDIVVTLSTFDLDLEIVESEREFPDLEPGESFENEDQPFVIEVSDETYPRTTSITLSVQAQPGDLLIEREFEVVIGHPDILIVDDDGGVDDDKWLRGPLDEAEKGWVHWDTNIDLAPDLDTMTDYEMVIWLTGHAEEPLDDLDRFQLEFALEEGAQLLMIGSRIGDDAANRSILRNYFGAMHQIDSVRAMTVKGLTGSPVEEEDQLYLFNRGEEGDARNSPSTMTTIGDADSLCLYYLGDDPVGLAGVYLNDYDLEVHRAYLGFALQSVNDMVTPRSEVLEQLYDWFMSPVEEPPPDFIGDEDVAADKFSVNPAYPNPFNSSVRINFTLPSMLPYSLTIIDIDGRNVGEVVSENGSAGVNQIVWDAKAQPAGIYFAKLHVPGEAPVLQKLFLIK